jgi:hypothetical protein
MTVQVHARSCTWLAREFTWFLDITHLASLEDMRYFETGGGAD